MPTSVDLKYINSAEYRNRFNGITGDEELDELLHKKAVDMLKHRNNTNYEDMYWVSVRGKEVKFSQTHSKKTYEVTYSARTADYMKKNGTNYITIHNHPNGTLPSGSDFYSNQQYGYQLGVIVGHNGTIYSYSVGKREISGLLIDSVIAKYIRKGYNESKQYELALEQLSKDYGIKWRRF